MLLISGIREGYKAYTTKETTQKTYEASNEHKTRNVNKVINDGKPISILLLGTDTGALNRHDIGRTDTIMVATINPKKKTTHLVSIPRDTRISIPGDSQSYEKINAAYTIGGPSQAISSVQHLLNIPIDYYALINMGGLEQMVDSVGGVTINPQLTFNYENIKVVKGQKQEMNGSQALSYTRMRYNNPLGDYGRQARQREVLQEIVKKGMKLSSIPRYKQILNSLNNNLKTDLQFKDMISIGSNYKDATNNIKSTTLQGQNATINGLSYQVPTDNEINRISKEINGYLEISNKK